MRNRLIISALRPTWTWNICLKIQLHRPKAPQTNLHNISPHTLHHLDLNVAAAPQTHGYMSSLSLSSPSNLPPWEVSSTSQPCSCLTDHLFVCFVRKDWKEHKHTHTHRQPQLFPTEPVLFLLCGALFPSHLRSSWLLSTPTRGLMWDLINWQVAPRRVKWRQIHWHLEQVCKQSQWRCQTDNIHH